MVKLIVLLITLILAGCTPALNNEAKLTAVAPTTATETAPVPTASTASTPTVSTDIASIGFSIAVLPTSNDTDTAFSTQPVVTAYKSDSSVATTDSTSSVVLTSYDTAACAGAVVTSGLSGTTTQTLSSGVATYTDIKAVKTGVKSIKATLGAFTACSSTLTINPGAIASVGFSTQPAPTSNDTDTAFTTQPVLKAYDANSNIVTTDSASTVALTTYDTAACAGAVVASGLSGTTTQTLASGVATYTDIKAIKIGVKSIKATLGAFTACSSTLTISAGAPATIAVSSGDAPSAAHHTAVPAFYAVVKDANANVASGVTVDWTVVLGGGSLSSASNSTDSSGLSSSILTLGTPGANSAKATVSSNAAINVTFTATATTTVVASSWAFDFGDGASYSYNTGLMDFTGGVCRLTVTDQIDNTNSEFTTSGVFSGIAYGTLSDGSTSGLKLATDGTCNGSTSNCGATAGATDFYEHASTWTPQWASLLSNWKMNNNWNDTTGTNNGTGSGSPTFSTTSKLGTHSGSFASASSQYVDTGNSATTKFTAANSFTIGAWINPTLNAADHTIVGNSGAAVKGYHLRITTANKLRFIVVSDGSNYKYSDSAALTSGWHYVVGVWNGTTTTNYVDGVQSLAATSGGTLGSITSTTNLMIGAGGSGYYDGKIDDLTIWSTALTAAEVQKTYERQAPNYTGSFTSRIMNAFAAGQSWTTFSWLPMLPFQKELPDYTGGAVQNETAANYPSLNTDTLMTNAVALWHLNETAATGGAGNDFKDDSVGNHSAEAAGGVTFGTPSLLNTGVTFNGSTGYLSATNSTSLTTTPITISAWVKFFDFSAATSNNTRVIEIQDGTYSAQILRDSTTGKWATKHSEFQTSTTSTTWGTPAVGNWYHVVAIFSASADTTKFYINGTAATAGASTAVGPGTVLNKVYLGVRSDLHSTTFMNGIIDEVTIWNRALGDGTSSTPNEILQLYQRGASRLKFQVRSCDDNACSGETWKGPDGTAGTYFSELNNNTVALDGTGDVQKGLPSLTLSAFTSAPSTNRYFQYRTLFESDTSTTTSMPELKTVTVAPEHYDTSSSAIYGITGVPYYTLNAFTQTAASLTTACPSGIGYNLGKGASAAAATWYWWDSSKASDCATAGAGAWCAAGGTVATSNAASVVHTNAAAFSTQLGTGTVYFKAFLQSSGTSSCELDQLDIGGTL